MRDIIIRDKIENQIITLVINTMFGIYNQYRTDAVERYLIDDDYTLRKNFISYPVGDRDLVPKPLDYLDFNYGGKYYFLLQLLPKELWYIIFDMKYVIEKMEYITFYFTPNYRDPELICYVNDKKHGKIKYFKPNTIWGRMHNDFSDILTCISNSNTRVERAFNMMFSFKEFVNRWYFFIKELVNNYHEDKKLHIENHPMNELFFKGNYSGIYRFLNLYRIINGKIFEFEENIFNIEDEPKERNKKVIAKILMYDIKKYAFKYLYEYNGLMDEPIEEGWRLDFFQYYFDFPAWVRDCGIETQDDLVAFMDDFTGTENRYYYNPKWFEKDEDSDDFPLWVMIQEFC